MKTLPMNAAAVLAAVVLAACASAHEPETPPPAATQSHEMAAPMAGHSEGSMELHRIMMQGHQMPMPMTGNVDKDFATMMTMHHRQALEMIDVLLKQGSDEELKAMARKMQAAQREEIEKMAPHTK